NGKRIQASWNRVGQTANKCHPKPWRTLLRFRRSLPKSSPAAPAKTDSRVTQSVQRVRLTLSKRTTRKTTTDSFLMDRLSFLPATRSAPHNRQKLPKRSQRTPLNPRHEAGVGNLRANIRWQISQILSM